MSVLEKFKATQPREFIYGRISKFTQSAKEATDKLYLWQNFVDYATEKTAVNYLVKDTDEDCAFLWRPTIKNFWDYVRQYELLIYDYISPSIRGLLIKPGSLWVPKAVVYDADAAFELYQTTYRDSAITSQKRYMRQLSEFNDILQYNSAVNKPWFVRSILTKNTLYS